MKLAEKQINAFGLAFSLLLMVIGFYKSNTTYFAIVFFVLLILATVPRILYPAAFLWFRLSAILGSVSSKVILTVVYIVLVVPLGIGRRWAGYSSMNANNFKKDTKTVFEDRNYQFTPEDFKKAF